MKYAIGIDIGGTNTKLGLVSSDGTILDFLRFKTKDYPTTDQFFKMLQSQIQNIKNQNPDKNILGLGIGAPSLDKSGRIRQAKNLPWPDVDLNQVFFSDTLQRAPSFENDANIAALDEYYFGKYKLVENLIVITLGTGVGSGIIHHKKLITGRGLASEAGHMVINTDQSHKRQCSCGQFNHLEAYLSAQGIEKTMHDLSGRWIKTNEISQLIKKKDQHALRTLDLSCDILTIGLVNLIHLFNPQVIIIAGGVSAIGEQLLSRIKQGLDKLLLPSFNQQLIIDITEQDQRFGAIRGAASLVFRSNEEKNHKEF
jgi:glucokinase